MKATFELDLSNAEQVAELIGILSNLSADGSPAAGKKTTATTKPATGTKPAAVTKPAAPTVTLAELRELTAVKSTDHRDAIKKQLKTYGVPNVTSIPEDKYEDYKTFLESLEEAL